MRIGILTLPLHTNYGGILQAYALQTVLERLGHEVVVIDISRKHSLPFHKALLAYPKRTISRYVLGRKFVMVRAEKYANYVDRVKRRNTQMFINKYVHCLEIKTVAQLNEKDYDAIVVGSDQIWRPQYAPGIEHSYLDFAEDWNIKRIAYAPSFGVDNWEYNELQTEHCKKLLEKFDAVSVREKSGVELCRKYLYHDALWVLDPTMLLQADDYIKLFDSIGKTERKEEIIFNYVLDPTEETESLTRWLASALGLKVIRANSRAEDSTAPLEERIQPPVEQWLKDLANAKFVITDSFHACVFSILFKKQFLVVANSYRGVARIDSLLGYLGLKNRIVRDAPMVNMLVDIDYDVVYKKLDAMRERSMDFLENALNL